MNILVIGNGFDLAHGLPTTYQEFLDFSYIFSIYNEEPNKKQFQFAPKYEKFKTYILGLYEKSEENEEIKKLCEDLIGLVKDNKWIEYFRKVNDKETWIDFESEISKVIQALDRARKARNQQCKINPEIDSFTMEKYDWSILKEIIIKSQKIKIEGIESIKERLLYDLNRLTRCLELYLQHYVGNITPKVKLPDIEGLTVNCVLSFNYTDTYKKIYHTDDSKDIEYDYIHGAVNPESSVDTCNLILGIDEYLSGEDRNQDNEFIQFKKFYQRIFKRTGCKYVEWIKNINDFYQRTIKLKSASKSNVYILGHSLDITDGDILSSLINAPNTKTAIFYHNQAALGKQISNLVKILGENELISRVHGKEASIVFQKQQEPVTLN